MQKSFTSLFILLFVLICVPQALGHTIHYNGPIHNGPELDYQPSIIRVEPSGQLMVVFERFGSSPNGDFYVSFSDNNGDTWNSPQEILASPLYERHPSLVQLGVDSFALFYLVDETGSGNYRIHWAASTDTINWTGQGRIDLGWATSGEINPNVIREANGDLTMTYHRLSGPSYIACSVDDGANWDTLRTQVSNANAQLPRLTKRESDGLYVVTYQVGGIDLDLFAKVSHDPYDWSGPQIPVSTDLNTHDSQPSVFEDGLFLVAYAKTLVNYFDVCYRVSCDGVEWSPQERVTFEPAHYDTQPHPLPLGAPGRFILLWSHQDSVNPYVDHDVWANNDLVLPESDLGASYQNVRPGLFTPGDALNYTFHPIKNDYGPITAWLTSTIPASVTLQPGSLWANSGSYGYDPVGRLITWTDSVDNCTPITLTYQVSTAQNLADGAVVSNVAWLSDSNDGFYALETSATADALPPTSTILGPIDGQWISSTAYLISGVSVDGVSGVAEVNVSIDGGPDTVAQGLENWSLPWSNISDGPHSLQVWALDQLGHAETPGHSITITVDSIPPTLDALAPPAGAANVPLAAPVVLTFSEPIVSPTLAFAVSPDPGGWTAAWNAEGAVVSLSHADFTPGQNYTFDLSAAHDRAHNPITPTQWTFGAACAPADISSVTTQIAGCQVSFGASVTGTPPLTWTWDFAAFGSSSQPSPTLLFDSGVHSWSLTLANCTGSYSDTLSGTVTVDCSPYLALSTKTVKPALAAAGDTLSYTLLLSNQGVSVTAWLSDPLPAELDYQAGSLWASSGRYGYHAAGRTITWTGELLTALPVTLTFAASAALDLADGLVLTNVAWLSSAQGISHTMSASVTVDASPPTLDAFAPSSGALSVALTANVVLTFSEPIVTSTLAYTITPNPGGWTAAWNAEGAAVTLGHQPFSEGVTYTVVVSAAQDRVGHPLAAAPCTWSFVALAGADTTPPAVTAYSPPDGAVDVVLDAAIVLTFSETINTLTFSYTLNPDPGGWSLAWGPGGGTALLPANSVVTLTHAAFDGGGVYSASVSAAEDLAGNPLADAPIEWAFSTVGQTYQVYLPVVVK